MHGVDTDSYCYDMICSMYMASCLCLCQPTCYISSKQHNNIIYIYSLLLLLIIKLKPMKVFGLFNMVAAYICTMICIVSVTYYVAITQQYANAYILAVAGFGMFMIARTLHNEWRHGKL